MGTARPAYNRFMADAAFVLIIIACFALAALFMLWESWLGSFYGPASSMFFNRVAVNDADLYRLCLFTPLTLLFGSFPVMGFCRRRKQRALRNQADA